MRHIMLSLFLIFVFAAVANAQLDPNDPGSGNCGLQYSSSVNSNGITTICIPPGPHDLIFACTSNGNNNVLVNQGCIEVECCDAGEFIVNWNTSHGGTCRVSIPIPLCIGGDCPVGAPCNDGNPLTVNDVYDQNCNCRGEESPCGYVDTDDNCHLTIDTVDENCNVTHTPPNPDDGCPLTIDIFDTTNCIIINEIPDVDDGCPGTYDYFDAIQCEIVHELLPCDDGNSTTVGDKYNVDCECHGCDPCQMEGVEWVLLCELLNR